MERSKKCSIAMILVPFALLIVLFATQAVTVRASCVAGCFCDPCPSTQLGSVGYDDPEANAIAVLDHIIGRRTLSPAYQIRADVVPGDGLNVLDAVAILLDDFDRPPCDCPVFVRLHPCQLGEYFSFTVEYIPGLPVTLSASIREAGAHLTRQWDPREPGPVSVGQFHFSFSDVPTWMYPDSSDDLGPHYRVAIRDDILLFNPAEFAVYVARPRGEVPSCACEFEFDSRSFPASYFFDYSLEMIDGLPVVLVVALRDEGFYRVQWDTLRGAAHADMFQFRLNGVPRWAYSYYTPEIGHHYRFAVRTAVPDPSHLELRVHFATPVV